MLPLLFMRIATAQTAQVILYCVLTIWEFAAPRDFCICSCKDGRILELFEPDAESILSKPLLWHLLLCLDGHRA